ncbi:MAG: polysaccharide deacetylase family protein [Candidatus Omnitrophica bacterium]|nr:polysaccharide deacetylase family protein [Candidatus Omnitrophota bacterium]MDE2213825.1 polysaccharide deacetylase family protein [Candidatus Omnitrophota bacterium]
MFFKRTLLFESRDRVSKKIALTFDDGPCASYTEDLLNIFKKEGIRSSFFFIGKSVKQHPEPVKRACQEGHLVGCHGYEHKSFKKLNDWELENDLELCRRTFKDVTGIEVRHVRPPYGAFDIRSLFLSKRKRWTTVLWTVDSRDFKGPAKENIVREVLDDKLRGGDIVLFHDTNAQTVEAVAELIPLLRSQGFSFVTVEDLAL